MISGEGITVDRCELELLDKMPRLALVEEELRHLDWQKMQLREAYLRRRGYLI